MGFYSGATISSGVDGSLENVQACYSTNFMEEAIMGVAESENNFNKIMRTIGIYEVSQFSQTGEEVVYTEGTLGSIIESVKKFLLSVWEKIKALFKRFVMMFDSWNKSDKDFVKKYKGEVVKRMANLKDFTYKGYKFTNLDNADVYVTVDKTKLSSYADGVINATVNDSKVELKEIEKLYEDFEDDKENARGEIVAKISKSSASSYTESEFAKALFEAFRDGESEKQEIDLDGSGITNIFAELMNSAKAKKDIDKAYKDSKRFIDKMIKQLENADKKALQSMKGEDRTADDKSAVKSKALQYVISAYRFLSSMLHVVDGALLTALKDRSRQNKSVMVKIISNVRADTSESASWEHPYYESSSLLDNVDLK